jgi:hypothetical protein
MPWMVYLRLLAHCIVTFIGPVGPSSLPDEGGSDRVVGNGGSVVGGVAMGNGVVGMATGGDVGSSGFVVIDVGNGVVETATGVRLGD